MTALDDALNEASVQYGPHQVKALWRETDGATDADANPDSPTLITSQISGSITVEHSFDDALPDPVTYTGNADAAGIFKGGLTGKDGLVLGSSGFRAYNSGGGSWDTGAATTTITAPIPTGAQRDDYIIAIVLVDDNTASLLQTTTDPKNQWESVGFIQDAPVAFWAFAKRRWKTNIPQLTLTSDKPVDYMSVSVAFWALNPTGIPMDYRLTHKNMANQGGAGPSFVLNGAQIDSLGYFVAFYGAASGNAWTAGTGLTEQGEQAGNGLNVMTATSAISGTGIYNFTSTQASANSIAVGAIFALEPFERPKWDAKQYFSPFNTDSPVYNFALDNAPLTAAVRVGTATGPVDTTIFDGQMQGLDIEGRNGTLAGVSKARLDMNRSITLPVVSGARENCTLDWMATYLMARGGSFVGTAPNKYSRYWAPLYGSTHAHWDTPYGYNNSYTMSTAVPTQRFGNRYPDNVNGKYFPAMYGQQTSTKCVEIILNPQDKFDQFTTDDFPHLFENGGTGPLMMDTFSLANSKGRLQMWVRGDAVQSAPSYLNAADDFIVKMILYVINVSGSFVGFIELGIASNSRNPYVKMGSDAAGYLSTSFVFSGLPTDGNWHFVGWSWDFAAGTANACFDGTVITSSGWASGGYNNTSGLASTDALSRSRGDSRTSQFYLHIPTSDLLLDFGETYIAGQWSEHYPTPKAPGANSPMFAAHTMVAGIAEPTAVNAWDTLAEVSKAALASYRCDEADVIRWFTMFHWGETTILTPVAVQDTTTNTADLDVTVDPSKARNVVTVQFDDTRIDTNPQPILLYNSVTTLVPGQTTITFALDTPAVEIHGQLSQSQSNASWVIGNLTSSQITTPSLPKTNHYITANTASDGTGTVLPSSKVNAKFVTWDAASVTIVFTNNSGGTAYLSNSGDQVPFMQILGYGFRATDGYVTVRDSSSVMIRGERAVDAEVKWITNRAAATDLAAHLANNLSKVKPQLKATVMGDPRRTPGQMITLLDKEGFKVSGTWRILAVTHNLDGAAYTQDLSLVPIDGIGVWDASTWDNAIWGA